MNRDTLTKLAALLRSAGDIIPTHTRRAALKSVSSALGITTIDTIPQKRNLDWDRAIEEAMRKGNGRFVLSDLTAELNVVPTVLGVYISKHYPRYTKRRLRVGGVLKWCRVLMVLVVLGVI